MTESQTKTDRRNDECLVCLNAFSLEGLNVKGRGVNFFLVLFGKITNKISLTIIFYIHEGLQDICRFDDSFYGFISTITV